MRISDWSSDVCSSDLPFSFPIPFVSSEVETPIGTALGRGASRLRSMRTDLLALTMPLRSPIGGNRHTVELAIGIARQFVPPLDHLRLHAIGEVLAKICRDSLFGGGAISAQDHNDRRVQPAVGHAESDGFMDQARSGRAHHSPRRAEAVTSRL